MPWSLHWSVCMYSSGVLIEFTSVILYERYFHWSSLNPSCVVISTTKMFLWKNPYLVPAAQSHPENCELYFFHSYFNDVKLFVATFFMEVLRFKSSVLTTVFCLQKNLSLNEAKMILSMGFCTFIFTGPIHTAKTLNV